MKKLILTLAAIFVIATPLYFISADAREQAALDAYENAEANARYIIEQHFDRASRTAVRRARSQEEIQHIQAFLDKVGGELLDPDGYMEALESDIFIRFEDAAAAVYFDLYLDMLSPDQLAKIADFYRSDAGQALLTLRRKDMVSTLSADDQYTGWLGRVSPIHVPAITMYQVSHTRLDLDALEPVLEARAEEQLADAAALMEQEYTAKTTFNLLAREDLVAFEDPAMRDYVVWYLTGRIGPEPPLPKQVVDPRVADTE